MKQPIVLALFAVCFFLLALSRPLPLVTAEEGIGTVLPLMPVTLEMLKSRIAEVKTAADPQDETRTKLVQLYRKTLSHLEEANANLKGAAAFEKATQTAPAQTALIREQIGAAKGTDPLETLDVGLTTRLEQIEQRLKKKQADLAAVNARHADFERRLTYQQNRPVAISQRLAKAKQQQEEVMAALKVVPTVDESPVLAQARRWVLTTRYAALSTKIKRLDQELLSQPMRVDLLEAKRDKEAASVAWIGARVKVLSDLVNRKRQLEAEQAKVEAEEAQRETTGLDPLLIRFAERNAELTDELNTMAARPDALDQEQAQAEKLAGRIAADYEDAKATLETVGLTEGLGRVLLEQRDSLPDVQVYRRKVRAHEQQIAEVGVRRLRHQAETRRIADLEQTVVELEIGLSAEKTPQLRDKLRDLVKQRQRLLEQVLEANEFYLRQLRELDAAERRLLAAVDTYNDFLNEHLLWLRNADPTRLEDLVQLPEETRRLLSAAIGSGLAPVFYDQVTHSPVFGLALLVAAALLWRRRTLIAAIEGTSAPLGKPNTDSFAHTLRALALTLVAAAPLSLLLAVMGWQLQVAAQSTDLSYALGSSLLLVALHLYILRALRMMCIPRGLAAAHFRWPESSVQRLRVELDRLTWLLILAMLVVVLAEDLNAVEAGGTIARLGFLVYFVLFVLFFYRVLRPRQGVFTYPWLSQEAGVLPRAYPLWFTLLLAFPLGLMTLALTGYIYSTDTLYFMFQNSLWMIVGLAVLHALALRWLWVARRRLAYEAAVERRQAALAARQTGEPGTEGEAGSALQFEEPEVDLAALSDDTRELIKITMIFAGLAGLYLIWSPLLPALRISKDVTLWYHTVTVDGEDKRLPITLVMAVTDLGLALLYAIGVGVLVKRLPAVLEIILLRRFDLSSGSRYTVTTLSTYALVAVGILLVLNTVGAQWSQFQWLVAALGVGIGFGLQEIVANFISGLIILFERPIRVGDIVTVGDTDGIVTKIRIRATTIRGWDHKELLVPNKEFITGRLFNWSLSDQVTRLLIVVGVAYGTDVDKALALMKEAAEEHEHVLDDPAPVLSFESFSDNSLSLVLRAYLGSIDHRLATITGLHKAINRKFEQAGIVIAFPQRDLHLDTRKPLRVSIEDVPQDMK